MVLTALQSLHLFGLRAFGACGNEEAYTLPFVKGLVTASFDLSEVNKNICAAFRGDETETFNFVKPLNSTSLASCHDVYLQNLRVRRFKAWLELNAERRQTEEMRIEQTEHQGGTLNWACSRDHHTGFGEIR